MKIAFTLCSNNYLAQTLSLRDSFLKHHPDYKFFIGLVDTFDAIASVFQNERDGFIPVDEVNIIGFADMQQRYNITELNTAVKPYYFEYLFGTYQPEWIFYIDPDIYVFNRFEEVEKALESGYEVTLTPHLLSSVGNGDISYLREGSFNLGFVAFNNLPTVMHFLKWWQGKVFNEGYFSFQKTQFYDQLWMNLSVCFFRKPYILYHHGYNVSGWNLHERKILLHENGLYVNSTDEKLVFYHFSGFSMKMPDNLISKWCPEITIDKRPDLKFILGTYRNSLIENKHHLFEKIKCTYLVEKKISFFQKFINKVINFSIILLKKNISILQKIKFDN